MGGTSRYDQVRPAGSREAAEARAFHTLGELVTSRPAAGLDESVRRQLAGVLHAAAIELDAGRAIPIGVRRAVLGLANALRRSWDPRTGMAARVPSAAERTAPDGRGSASDVGGPVPLPTFSARAR